MDSLLLYAIVAGALGLMAAGAYGAAPAFFPKRQVSIQGPSVDGIAGMFARGAAFPLLEDDLAQGRQDLAAAVLKTADGGSSRVEATADLHDVYRGDDDEERSEPFDQELLSDLFTEIGMLRVQIEVLRTELGNFATSAASAVREKKAAAPVAPSEEPRRRLRTQPSSGLPLALRRRFSDIRRQRRSGGAQTSRW